MSERRNGLWRMLALLIVTAVVASTAIRIEWYNHAVGGFLPRPQPPSIEGNDVKWRATGAWMAERMYRERLLYEKGIEYSEDNLQALELTASQQTELAEIKRQARLNAEFRSLVGSMGLWQYPFVTVGLVLSWLVVRERWLPLRLGGAACLAIHVAACGLMFYREYFPSLGW